MSRWLSVCVWPAPCQTKPSRCERFLWMSQCSPTLSHKLKVKKEIHLLCRAVQSRSRCYHMELTVGHMARLMCLWLGVQSATQHHTRTSERHHNTVVLCVTLPMDRDEMCLSSLPELWVAESRGTRRLNWSYCSTWVNIGLRMNAGYERAGWDARSHVRAGAADHMITSEMPAVPPASL